MHCCEALLPEFKPHTTVSPSEHHFELKGDSEYVFSLKGKRLTETNPVPIIINQIMEMEGIESERQSLFTVLTELYVNSLDHGVLGLQSSMKSDPAGFTEYFKLREQRLNNLQSGHVIFNLTIEQNDDIRSILIRIEDSGSGFDYVNQPAIDPLNHTGFSGRGIYLIRDLCESLSYLGNGNIAEAIYSWKTV